MMRTRIAAILLLFFVHAGTASSQTSGPSQEMVKQEAQKLLEKSLWGDYDIDKVQIQTIEDLSILGRDYPLTKAVVSFSAKRNEHRSKYIDQDGRTVALNQNLYDDEGLCAKVNQLYLYCGVDTGHVFEGDLELLLVKTNQGWEILNPNWRRKTSYPLEGYLIMEGKEKEGYVLFPKE